MIPVRVRVGYRVDRRLLRDELLAALGLLTFVAALWFM